MNCKPNELARVISHPSTIEFQLVDKIITTLTQVTNQSGEPTWTYEPVHIATCPCGCGYRVRIDTIPDRLLRPIRNPGDDVIDDAKEFQPPVPTKIAEPA